MEADKINHIFDLALDHFEDQALFHKWLEAKNPVMDGNRPIDLIAKGALDKLISLLDH